MMSTVQVWRRKNLCQQFCIGYLYTARKEMGKEEFNKGALYGLTGGSWYDSSGASIDRAATRG
jgi:hypothetical protein